MYIAKKTNYYENHMKPLKGNGIIHKFFVKELIVALQPYQRVGYFIYAPTVIDNK